MFNKIYNKIQNFWFDDRGVTAIEFGIVIVPVMAFIMIFIDLGYWSIANTTLKKSSQNFLDSWVQSKESVHLPMQTIYQNICNDVRGVGIPCNDEVMNIHIEDTPKYFEKWQDTLNFETSDQRNHSQRLFLMLVRLKWPDFFPISNFLMRAQGPTEGHIYTALLLPN